MITKVLDLLIEDPFYGAGRNTEIAKGKHKQVSSYKEFKEQIKRLWLKN